MAKLLIVCVLFVCIVATVRAKAINYKKKYCANNDYIGNAGSKYPHLHCDKTHLTLSRGKNIHDNLQGKCNKVEEILNSQDGYYGNANSPCEITAILKKYYNDGCPTESHMDDGEMNEEWMPLDE